MQLRVALRAAKQARQPLVRGFKRVTAGLVMLALLVPVLVSAADWCCHRHG